MINQAATHHFLPAQIQGAGREGEGGGAGRSPRPLQAPGRWRARGVPPSLTSSPPARLALFGGAEGGGERAARRSPPRRRGRPELGSRDRGGRRRGVAARVSAQVGAGGAVWTAPGVSGREVVAASRPGDCGSRAAGVLLTRLRLDSQREASVFTSRPFLTCLQIPFHFIHFLARSGIMLELAISQSASLVIKICGLVRGGGFCSNLARS